VLEYGSLSDASLTGYQLMSVQSTGHLSYFHSALKINVFIAVIKRRGECGSKWVTVGTGFTSASKGIPLP
jgi:hypothetical protein